jgi:hypothetical protein
MPDHRPPKAAILVLPAFVALIVTLFAWPNARLEPRDLPIGVAGPPAAADAVADRLAEQEGAFEIHRYADEEEAREGIEDREVYGAFVVSDAGARVLTATGASQAVAQLLSRAASELPAPNGPVEVEDVVPAAHGAALGSSVLPLVLAGVLTGFVATGLTAAGWQRVGLLIAVAVLSGMAAALVVQTWLDVVAGSWIANAAVLSLTVLAIAAFVAGALQLFGLPGAVLAALVMVLIGNPFSGVGSAPELLPQPIGAIGQLMPPGAGGNLLRSTGFFDGADAGGHIAVLLAWTLVGLGALMARSDRSESAARSGPPRARPA